MTINLDEITRALGEITQGEWFVDPEGPEYSVNCKGPLNPFRHVAMVDCYIRRHGDKEENEANAHLISHAPEWLRRLVERVRKLEKALQFYARLDYDMGYDEIEEDHGRRAVEALAKEQDDD